MTCRIDGKDVRRLVICHAKTRTPGVVVLVDEERMPLKLDRETASHSAFHHASKEPRNALEHPDIVTVHLGLC